MTFWKQILTGADNQTIAIGRVIGIVLLALVVLAPVVELLTVAFRRLTIEQWGAMLAQWQAFMPLMVAAAGGVIWGTSFTEPKPGSDNHG